MASTIGTLRERVSWSARWSLLGIAAALLILALALALPRLGRSGAEAPIVAPPRIPPVQLTGQTCRGVDVSKYSGEIPAAKWTRLKARGWDFAVVGAWGSYGLNPLARQQLSAARGAGLRTAAYALLHYNDPNKTGTWQVEQALAAAGDEVTHLDFVALDVEGKGGPVKTDVLACIRDAASALEGRGLRPVIYASRRDWLQLTGDTREFAHLPLWIARFDGEPELNTDAGKPWVPFGGWTAQAAKQHTGSTNLHGVHADLNISDTGLWSPS